MAEALADEAAFKTEADAIQSAGRQVNDLLRTNRPAPASPTATSGSAALPGTDGAPSRQAPHEFLEVARPFIQRAVCRLHAGIRAITGSHPATPVDAASVETILVGLLPNRLLPILLRTMVLELNVARVQGLLAGETSEQRFASFIERIKQPRVRSEFFGEYPVLGRQIVTALEQWLSCSLEFLQRWCADWPAICATFETH